MGAAPEGVGAGQLPTAVKKKAPRYDPQFNPSYAGPAEHYSLAVLPARVKNPRHKACVSYCLLC
jgi:transposase